MGAEFDYVGTIRPQEWRPELAAFWKIRLGKCQSLRLIKEKNWTIRYRTPMDPEVMNWWSLVRQIFDSGTGIVHTTSILQMIKCRDYTVSKAVIGTNGIMMENATWLQVILIRLFHPLSKILVTLLKKKSLPTHLTGDETNHLACSSTGLPLSKFHQDIWTNWK